MKPGENRNHPQPGSTITVEPIRDIKGIAAIKKQIEHNPMYTALFTLGINTNLRAGDLLGIKVGQVRGLRPMDELDLREEKTGNRRRISLNKSCIDAVRALLASRTYQNDDFLFLGQRGERLTVPSVNRLVKQWCSSAGISGNYGSHTLRKTWGYHQRVTFGVGLPELMTVFGHATQRQTLSYLCVQPDEVKNVYANEL
jgi:integrase